jgi:hypothetical protein
MYSRPRLPALLLASLPLTGLAPAAYCSAEISAQHAAHEHGKVTLHVSVDDTRLSIELIAPALNIIGMERPARNDEERAHVAAVHRWLASGSAAFGVPRAAACRREAVPLTAPHLGAGAHDEHADYRVVFSYRCASPRALQWVEFWLLERLFAVEAATTQVLAGSLQTSVAVTRGRERVALK